VRPVVFVEDEWLPRSIRPTLEEGIGRSVEVAADFIGLATCIAELVADINLEAPIVVLDPGIPGVCRLDAVRRVRQIDDQLVVVVWTSTRARAFLGWCMVDGAVAAVPKQRTERTLVDAILRAERGRHSLDPEQAQWFGDLLRYMKHCYKKSQSHVWALTELEKVDGLKNLPEWLDALDRAAAGEPIGADDRWLRDLLKLVRSYWMDDHLRRALLALAISPTRASAAEAIGRSPKTMDGYCSKLSGMLLPGRYLDQDAHGLDAARNSDEDRGPSLNDWIVAAHLGCEVADAQHTLELAGPPTQEQGPSPA